MAKKPVITDGNPDEIQDVHPEKKANIERLDVQFLKEHNYYRSDYSQRGHGDNGSNYSFLKCADLWGSR